MVELDLRETGITELQARRLRRPDGADVPRSEPQRVGVASPAQPVLRAHESAHGTPLVNECGVDLAARGRVLRADGADVPQPLRKHVPGLASREPRFSELTTSERRRSDPDRHDHVWSRRAVRHGLSELKSIVWSTAYAFGSLPAGVFSRELSKLTRLELRRTGLGALSGRGVQGSHGADRSPIAGERSDFAPGRGVLRPDGAFERARSGRQLPDQSATCCRSR